MLERQRLQYLSILGIDNYMPRRLLQGAAGSVLLSAEQLQPIMDSQTVLPSLKEVPVDSTQQEKVGNQTVDVGEELSLSPKTLLDTIESPPAKGDVPEAALVDREPVAPSAVEFVFTIWRINDDCLIVDSHQPGTALPTDRLLLNILRAIGYSLVQLPQSDSIRWPLFTGNQYTTASNDTEEACAMVQAYMTAQVTKGDVKQLLLMGDAAFSYVVNHDQTFDQCQGGLITDAQWQATIAVLPSLTTMLTDPTQKAIAWKALKQL